MLSIGSKPLADRKFMETALDGVRRVRESIKAAQRWKRIIFSDVPCLFGNAMPKSGSHLVLQILQGLAQVAPFSYVAPKPIRMITPEGRNRSTEEITADLNRLSSSAIEWGYLRAEAPYLQFFEQHQDVLSFFAYRDSCDRLISSIFYAVDIHQEHAQHDFYASLPMAERITAAIQGRDESSFRKGKAGGWREHFMENHKRLFKQVAGKLLITLGYEGDHDW